MIRHLLLSAALLILMGCNNPPAQDNQAYQPSTALILAQQCLAGASTQQCLSEAFPQRCARWVNASLKQPQYNLQKLANCASTCQYAPTLSRWFGACSSII